MLTKLLLLVLVAAASAKDLDSVFEHIFGTTNPAPPETTSAPKNTACDKLDGKKGECVPYYLCEDKSTYTPSGLIDVHFPMDSGCESYIDVCCDISDKVPPPIIEKDKRVGCGWGNPAGAGGVSLLTRRHTGEADFGEFPWICAVLRNNPTNAPDNQTPEALYIGSGTLIHPRVVLTVAHMVSKPGQYRVRCGEWDSVNEIEPLPSQEETVEEVVVHEEFSQGHGNLYNDAALLFLSKPMQLSSHINTACLPPPELKVGGSCLTTGWGKDKFGKLGQYYTNILKKVDLSILNTTYCEEVLQGTRLGKQFHLHETFGCAGDQQDHCSADGGAPVVCPIEGQEDRYTAVGAIAWWVGCVDTPAVYLDTTTIRRWVDRQFDKFEFDTVTYTY